MSQKWILVMKLFIVIASRCDSSGVAIHKKKLKQPTAEILKKPKT